MNTALLLLLTWPVAAVAQQIAIGEYNLPTGDNWQDVITVGPDGALWFTENPGNKIGRITTAGKITEYPLPAGSQDPYWITTGPDGALWFTETGNIGRITTEGAITLYPLPATETYADAITAGPDGALWFTTNAGRTGVVGRITTAGRITEYAIASPLGTYPVGITAGPDGALWFTEVYGNQIGRITTAGAITTYPVPTAKSGLWDITRGPDGALWFTEQFGNKIGRITTAGVITEYATLAYGSAPGWITTGPDGALWFTESATNRLGRISTAGAITEYLISNYYEGSSGIALGPDGGLWFGVASAAIGEAVFVTANLSVSPASGYYQSPLNFTGNGFAPGETVRIYKAGVGSPVLASAKADASGSMSATALAPESAYDARIFLGVGASSGKLGAANFQMGPELILTPDSGPAGTTVTVEGYGFSALMTSSIYWDSNSTLLGTVTMDNHGTFTGMPPLTFTVPEGASPGAHTVMAVGGEIAPKTISATFTVSE